MFGSGWPMPPEELLHIGLHPAAAQFDDGDDAAAGEAGRPIIGGTQIGHVPRAAASGFPRRRTRRRHLEVGFDVGPPDGMEIRMHRGPERGTGSIFWRVRPCPSSPCECMS